LVKKVCVVAGDGPCPPEVGRFNITTTGNNPQPSNFFLANGESQLVTLGAGAFTVTELSIAMGFLSLSFSGDCRQAAPGSFTATGTISAGQHLTCTITNTLK
jgi:hypothetical protein